MKRMLLNGLTLMIAAATLPAAADAAGQAAVELFVAPDGQDAHPGTQAMPLQSLEAVRDRLRQWRTQNPDAGPCTVWIRGGVYLRDRTFQLTEQDGGTAALPVIYRSYGQEEVRLVGGRRLEPGWCRPVKAPDVLARLPEEVRHDVLQVDLKARGMEDYGELSILAPMLELFSDGRRLPLSRYPNEGWMHLGPVVQLDEQGQRQRVDGHKQATTFCYLDDRPRRWLAADQLVLHGFWWFGWTDEHVPVQQIDLERREITLTHVPSGGMRKDQWFRALNLLEEIDAPGEWYLDRSAGILYFLPPPGFPQEPLFVSTLDEPLIRIDGASHVTLRDLILEVTRGVAAVIGGGEYNRLAGCTLRGIGSDAVVVDHGRKNGLVGCDIYHVGGTAVHMTGGNRSTLEAAGNYVQNCHIHDYAQRKLVYRPAVRLYGVGHHVAHNLIHDAPHQAIAYDGNDHLIELNEIHHVVLNSADAGVMYTGCDWTFRGNVVRHNYIHQIPHGPGLGTVGIYLDDCCSSTTIFGNVFYDMLKPASLVVVATTSWPTISSSNAIHRYTWTAVVCDGSISSPTDRCMRPCGRCRLTDHPGIHGTRSWLGYWMIVPRRRWVMS